MVEKHSGVFVNEKFPQPKKETSGLSGSVALIGVTRKGAKDIPIAVANYKELIEKFGTKLSNSELYYNAYAAFKEGAARLHIINPKIDSFTSIDELQFNDQKAIGGIIQNLTKSVLSVVGANNLATFTVASVLYNSNTPAYINHNSNVPIAISSGMDIDLNSFRVIHSGIVIGKADSQGNIVPVFNSPLTANSHLRVKSGANSKITLDTSALRPDENCISIELEVVTLTTGAVALGTAQTISIEYCLNNLDNEHKQVIGEYTLAADGPVLVFDLSSILDSNYDTLAISDFALGSLSLTDGTTFYNYYNGKLYTSAGAVLDAVATSITFNTTTKELTFTNDSIDFTAGDFTVGVKVNVTNQAAYHKDRSIVQSGNVYYSLSSKYEAEEYNKIFLRVFSKDEYCDSKFNTAYFECDIYEKIYLEDGVTEANPLLVEDMLKLSTKTTDANYFIDTLNDERNGSKNITINRNGVDNKIPHSIKYIGIGNTTTGIDYSGIHNLVSGISATIQLIGGSTRLQQLVKGSVSLKVYNATNTLLGTLKDNGIGGFYNVANRQLFSGWSVNYETGVITTNTNLTSFTGATYVLFTFAQKNIQTYIDCGLSKGVGGTEIQSAMLSNAVLTDDILKTQARGIYAVSKILGEFVIWGIPDLASNYDIALKCMQYVDSLAVKSQIYVWNMDDTLSAVEVGNSINNFYTYRTKNAVVAYPRLNIEDFDTQRLVSISFVGTLAGKMANKVGTRRPHESIAGTLNGVIQWGISPTKTLSLEETGEFKEYVIPVISSYDTGFVVWGDSSLADEATTNFKTVSHTLVFNVIQYEAQRLLWSEVFANITNATISRMKSNLSRYLIAKAELGWFGTDVIKDSFEVDVSANNEITKRAKELYAEISFLLPESAQRVYLTVFRKF